MLTKITQFFLKDKKRLQIVPILLFVISFYCTWPGSDRKIWDNPFDPTNPNKAQPPRIVNVTKDTTIGINDSLWVKVSAISENTNVVEYLWSLDNGYTVDTTEKGEYLFLWSKNDTGQKVISVWAVNEYLSLIHI
ncbi:MAG: hypothetical protein N2053_10545, partial [Chitinispirillaceae bacterium]|nr:hypothetical protein [Chitinispirillaceae bacterium]